MVTFPRSWAWVLLLAGCGRQDFEGLWSGEVCDTLPMEMELDSWGLGVLRTIAPLETDDEASPVVPVDLDIEVTQDFRAFIEPMQSHEIRLGSIDVRRGVMTGNAAWDPTEYGPCSFEIALQ